MTLFSLAWHSLGSRRKSVVLTFFSLLISISVLLSVEHLRLQAKESFNRTVSGVDIIVGAPSGQLNLLLYSVFRMGTPTNSIKYSSYQTLKNHSLVEWAVPISLGDSHHGFRVLGTSQEYFQYFKYADKKGLVFEQGQAFTGMFDTVIGSDVAKQLGYKLGDKIVIAHGIAATSFTHHDNAPFTITGILKPTGTPVDKTVHTSLAGIEAVHLSPRQLRNILEGNTKEEIAPRQVTAVMLGLKSRLATFKLQRDINNTNSDKLMAILPGVAMTELWQLMGTVENLLRVIGFLVLISSLFGLSTMLLASMDQRKGEIAVLRILGAGPRVIFSLVLLEALILVLLAIAAASGLISLTLYLSGDWLASHYGLFLSGHLFSTDIMLAMLVILGATIATAIVPAIEAYKSALHTVLSSKL
ncbi:ABC transporter permease [Alteromonadaceae bacterium M269]|nr:ABC transporter permease [Alteromonadaceae bacterium M269]